MKIIILVSTLILQALAQHGFFDQFFGGQHEDDHHGQMPDFGQRNKHAEQTHEDKCPGYVCEKTYANVLVCADEPQLCPCLSQFESKCKQGGGYYICVVGKCADYGLQEYQ